ncbi:MAG: SRPBCC family protein [Anaerolineae bacterium]|nr:SRPBCC family protein [Anaerolineae bacterium]
MSLIDHRILVNAPPDVVWNLLGNLAALPQWQVNCVRTSILTTHEEGVGVRRRNTLKRGPEVVEEIVSWYPNLGYEYVVVDGGAYQHNRGRVRLQAIPEGTIVQWTFEYELGGFLSGLRDRLAISRQLDSEIADSLRQLKRLIEAAGTRMDTATIAKVSMQPAPSAHERATLAREAAERDRARQLEREQAAEQAALEAAAAHAAPTVEMPTVVLPEPVPAADEAAWQDVPPLDIVEPPISDEDTRPRPTLDDTSEHPAVVLPEDVPLDEEEDTRPNAPVTPPESALVAEPFPVAVEPQSAPITGLPPEPAASDADLFRAPIAAPDLLDMEEAPPTEPEAPTQPSLPASAPETSTAPVQEPVADPVGPSIWDVFGVAPPSEAETTPTPRPPEPAISPAAPLPAAQTRERASPVQDIVRVREPDTSEGLRERLARQRAKVRQG